MLKKQCNDARKNKSKSDNRLAAIKETPPSEQKYIRHNSPQKRENVRPQKPHMMDDGQHSF